MRKIKKTSLAEEDLIDIWLYTLEEWGEQQADYYLEDLSKTFQRIQQTPKLASERSEFVPPVRIHPHNHHLIIYTIHADYIRIIRVLHEHMDIDSHLIG